MRSDPKRLAQLRRQLILDSPREPAYDDITTMLASSLDVPIAMINFLDERRDWFKSAVGTSLRESSADTSFCEAFLGSTVDLIVVEDTYSDARFASHPMVVGAPFMRFYAAARVTSGEHTVGTLCAYDLQPRKITVAQVETVRTLAHAVIELLQKRESVTQRT